VRFVKSPAGAVAVPLRMNSMLKEGMRAPVRVNECSDCTQHIHSLGLEPDSKLREGLARTMAWNEQNPLTGITTTR
jgi:nucleoside-diphosphate-sugar epimerase